MEPSKNQLTSITTLDSKFKFEIMCDASDYVVGAVLRQMTLQGKRF